MKGLIFALLAIFLAIAACNAGYSNAVRGSGNVVTQSFGVSGFDQIELTDKGEVIIEQGESESLVIETDDNILPYLVVNVEGGKLTLGAEDNINLEPSVTITHRVTVKTLSAVIAGSSGNLFVGPVTGESLDVFVNASGGVTLKDMQVKKFSIASNGSGVLKVDRVEAEDIQIQSRASGKVEIAGETTSLKVEAGGSGDVLAGDLQSSKAEVAVLASGDVTVRPIDALEVIIGADGNVAYYGEPAVTKSITGSGTVKALGNK